MTEQLEKSFKEPKEPFSRDEEHHLHYHYSFLSKRSFQYVLFVAFNILACFLVYYFILQDGTSHRSAQIVDNGEAHELRREWNVMSHSTNELQRSMQDLQNELGQMKEQLKELNKSNQWKPFGDRLSSIFPGFAGKSLSDRFDSPVLRKTIIFVKKFRGDPEKPKEDIPKEEVHKEEKPQEVFSRNEVSESPFKHGGFLSMFPSFKSLLPESPSFHIPSFHDIFASLTKGDTEKEMDKTMDKDEEEDQIHRPIFLVGRHFGESSFPDSISPQFDEEVQPYRPSVTPTVPSPITIPRMSTPKPRKM